MSFHVDETNLYAGNIGCDDNRTRCGFPVLAKLTISRMSKRKNGVLLIAG